MTRLLSVALLATLSTTLALDIGPRLLDLGFDVAETGGLGEPPCRAVVSCRRCEQELAAGGA